VHQIAHLTEKAEQIGAKVIFYMENSNPVFAEQIASKVGAKVLMLHSCHTLTKAELEQGKNYVSIMEENIKNISEALK
jgi:zinc transport system substrate-binding protein